MAIFYYTMQNLTCIYATLGEKTTSYCGYYLHYGWLLNSPIFFEIEFECKFFSLRAVQYSSIITKYFHYFRGNNENFSTIVWKSIRKNTPHTHSDEGVMVLFSVFLYFMVSCIVDDTWYKKFTNIHLQKDLYLIIRGIQSLTTFLLTLLALTSYL